MTFAIASAFARRCRFGSVIFLAASTLFAQPRSVTILHTNDIHAGFVPREATWIRTTPRPQIGGFVELASAVDSLKRIHPSALLIDAGDVMTGNPITEYSYDRAQGGALFEMMKMVGYDLWCPGNHDFDISQANLSRLMEIGGFPTTCANLVDSTGKPVFHDRPSIIFTRDGVRIGIFGLMSRGLYGLVNQNNLTGIRVLDPIATARKMVAELTPSVDLVVALTHEGVEDDSVLASAVSGINVIVGGHSHTRLRQPKLVNGVLIVQTGANCENLGELNLTVEDHKVIKYNGTLIQLWYNSARTPSRLSSFADSIANAIQHDYQTVLATLKGDWIKPEHGEESAIGSFIADAQREAAHADVGFMNDHGIRKNMNAGPLTKNDLFEILPFRNMLVTFELSGRQIRDVLEYYFARHPAIQFSGIRCQFTKGAGGTTIRSIDVNGKPLDEKKMYVAAASDYFAGEAIHYIGLAPTNVQFSRTTVFSAVEEKVRAAGVITPAIDGRLREIQ